QCSDVVPLPLHKLPACLLYLVAFQAISDFDQTFNMILWVPFERFEQVLLHSHKTPGVKRPLCACKFFQFMNSSGISNFTQCTYYFTILRVDSVKKYYPLEL